MAIDEERGWLYVTNEISDTVHLIQETEIIATLPIGKRPRDVTVNPVTGLAYVISESPGSKPGNYSNQLTVLSGPNIMDTVQFGQDLGALQVVIDPVREDIYVRMSQGHLITLHDHEEVARLELEYGITKIDVHPQTGDVYVIGGQRLYKFSDRQQVLQTRLVHGNTSLRNMRVHPITGDIYIVQSSEDSGVLVVREFDDHFGVIGRVDTGAATFKMTVDPFTQNVYTASFHHNTVSAIHGTELLATYEVGWYPYGIGVNPANGWVYVSNTNEDTVTILGFPNRIRLPLILNK
jgi:DNA-binding beta-propeller fold protein YncE